MKPIVIFGLGDYARIACVYLEEDNRYPVAAFTANADYIQADTLLDKPVVPFENLVEQYPPDAYDLLVAIGFSRMNQARAKVYHEARALGYAFPTYVHPNVKRWPQTHIGENTFIFENNVVQPFVTIGDNTVVWSGNHIGHDTRVGNHVFIASHAVISGNVVIGDHCFIGVNATIADGVTVAPYSLIGAGALITRDTEPEDLYKGVKAEKSGRKTSEIDF